MPPMPQMPMNEEDDGGGKDDDEQHADDDDDNGGALLLLHAHDEALVCAWHVNVPRTHIHFD